MSDAFTNLTDGQKGEFIKWMEEKQMKDSLAMYSALVENCFDKCVNSGWGGGFRSKQLEDSETKCLSQCAEKFMKVTQRVGFRFTEYQAMKDQEMKNK